MKLISETLTELGIAFSFPIRIKDANGDETYYEDSDSDWVKWEYDAKGYVTYYETSDGDWGRWEYDANDNVTYYEASDGFKSGTPRSTTTNQ